MPVQTCCTIPAASDHPLNSEYLLEHPTNPETATFSTPHRFDSAATDSAIPRVLARSMLDPAGANSITVACQQDCSPVVPAAPDSYPLHRPAPRPGRVP